MIQILVPTSFSLRGPDIPNAYFPAPHQNVRLEAEFSISGVDIQGVGITARGDASNHYLFRTFPDRVTIFKRVAGKPYLLAEKMMTTIPTEGVAECKLGLDIYNDTIRGYYNGNFTIEVKDPDFIQGATVGVDIWSTGAVAEGTIQAWETSGGGFWTKRWGTIALVTGMVGVLGLVFLGKRK